MNTGPERSAELRAEASTSRNGPHNAFGGASTANSDWLDYETNEIVVYDIDTKFTKRRPLFAD